MSAALWTDILRDIASSKKHLAFALQWLEDERSVAEPDQRYMRSMALQHAMQSGYTSFELGMKRLLTMLGEPPPTGADSHRSLLLCLSQPMAGSRPAILDAALREALSELRRFRHVAMHGYDQFDLDKAGSAVGSVRLYLAEIDPAIARFRAIVDPA